MYARSQSMNHEKGYMMDKDAEIAKLVAANDELEDELTKARSIIKVLQTDKEYADRLIDALRKAWATYGR